VERLIRTRKETPEFGWGTCEVLDSGHPALLLHRCAWRGNAVVAVHNLSDRPAELTLPGEAPLRVVLADGDEAGRLEPGETLALGPYGYRWLREDGVRR